jgi:hypothetical protein
MISFMAQAVCSVVSAWPLMRARISNGQLGVSIIQLSGGEESVIASREAR